MSMIWIRPATLLFFIVVIVIVYKLFVRLLNSRKFSRKVDDLTHPSETKDLVGRAQRVRHQVEEAITERDEEIDTLKSERKSLRNLKGKQDES